MNATEHHPAHSDEGSSTSSVNVATTSTTAGPSAATEPLRNHDDLPWHNRIPKDKRVTQAPVAVNLVLPPVRAELGRGIKALNSIVSLIEHGAFDHEDLTIQLSPDVYDTFSSHRETVTNSFETAIVMITTIPGYVCKKGSAEHERRYTERHKALSAIEDDLTHSMEEAEPLFKARNELMRAEYRYRRRLYIQTAFRALSIVTVPYLPFLSAVFTAADLFGVSVSIAIQRVVFPNDDHLDETLQRVITLEQDIQRKVAEVKRLRENLEEVRAKLEEEQRHPIATQLAEILDKVFLARHAAMGALSPPCDKCACSHVATPISKVVASLRVMADALEAPTMFGGPLASLSETGCAAIDRALVMLRTSPPAPASAGSD